MRNTVEQLKLVGPRSLGVALLTAGFVGMVFTIQACARASPPAQIAWKLVFVSVYVPRSVHPSSVHTISLASLYIHKLCVVT